MDSPFPKSSSAPGEGRIVARLLPNGQPGFESITYQYPLKLISPSLTAGEKSALVFLLSYGGGLVGGDHVHLEILVRPDARLSIVTQGHTKIFKAASKTIVTRQALRARIAARGRPLLAAGPRAALLTTAARSARGEDWGFARWKGRNEIWLGGDDGDDGDADETPAAGAARLLVRDTVVLDERASALTGRPLRGSMHGHGVFGSLLLRGPQMQRLGEFFLAEFGRLPRLGARDFRTVEAREREETDRSAEDSWRLQRLAMEKQHAVLWSAASVRGCVVVKFGAGTVEGGRVWIAHMLSREGSITELYGDQAMICLR
ncbi:urease accessory protein UreD [Verticillium alfalfae VaMs.102]|uniref:Urease accessory protein UreD n=1 Tax=Verticillium alfalfae (strain VaMs.102 / ATCC MYA-4576 / FGSC 10136) TaxID=526221 RepID=C9S8C3_VERA1|nr:urease accessory protein UreD [Verticillium alfalfae VaMs.102]EEY13933.1 urease accessory protein UreD [Verticillium alfalfae VaMs.102]